MKSIKTIIFISLVILTSSFCCRFTNKTDRVTASKSFKKQVDKALPTVVSLTGIQNTEPVKVDMLTKAELGKLIESRMELEYPNEELKKRARCFAEIGLLPREYDLENGFVELLKEQAGAIYDPHSRTVIGISDLPHSKKRAINDKMIVSHELTHAVQDRIIDIRQHSEMGLKNIDYEYAIRAVLEGMASAIMIAHTRNLTFDNLPDLQSFWRSNFSKASGEALSSSPEYVKEYLLSPYAEGGAFLQSWQRANPQKTMADLFKKIPSSSEQVLHFEKYTERDEPTEIDLSRVRRILPKDWKLFYANTLGEFDLLKLFMFNPKTETNAVKIADGWDGCQFEAYEDTNKEIVLIGSSVWDTENDAKEFQEGFDLLLQSFRDSTDFKIVRMKSRVDFVIGVTEGNLKDKILSRL
jgi:hypothetical protein